MTEHQEDAVRTAIFWLNRCYKDGDSLENKNCFLLRNMLANAFGLPYDGGKKDE